MCRWFTFLEIIYKTFQAITHLPNSKNAKIQTKFLIPKTPNPDFIKWTQRIIIQNKNWINQQFLRSFLTFSLQMG